MCQKKNLCAIAATLLTLNQKSTIGNKIRHLQIVVCVTISMICISSLCYSQAIQPLRYNDDFSYLKDDSSRRHKLHLKYIKLLGNNNYVSVGGEIRQQIMYLKNISFGEISSSFKTATTWQTLHRMMLHLNVDLGKNVRVFTQAYSTMRFINPNPKSAVDQNDLDLHQAFVDFKPSRQVTLRLGRQEYLFGKERFMGVREGPNNRQSFDAATVKYSSDKVTADIYYAKQIIPAPGVFDDKNSGEHIAGIYTRFTAVPQRALFEFDFHAFGSRTRTYNYTIGTERRKTAGFRFYSLNKILNYEIESATQWGSFMDKTIKAYSVAYDVNYLLNKRLLAGLSGNFFTGDKDPADNEINTYNTMFGKPPYGQAAMQGLANSKNINPYLRVYLNTNVNVLGGMNIVRRVSNKDAVYSNGMRVIRPQAEDKLLDYSSGKIGQVFNLDVNLKFGNNFSATIQGATYVANDFIKQSGKSNQVYFFSTRGVYRF